MAATWWMASSVVGAFSFARNLSRSISACFFVIAPSPLLGPTDWYFRAALVVPSGRISSDP